MAVFQSMSSGEGVEHHVVKSAAATLTIHERFVEVETAAAIIIKLPHVGPARGYFYQIHMTVDAGNLTIADQGDSTGWTDKVLTNIGDKYIFYSDGRHWIQIFPRIILIPWSNIDAADIEMPLFVAPIAMRLLSVREVHTVVAGAAAKGQLEKRDATDAIGAGTDMLVSTGVDFEVTALTPQTVLALATAAIRNIAAGQILSFVITGTETNLVGSAGVIVLEEI